MDKEVYPIVQSHCLSEVQVQCSGIAGSLNEGFGSCNTFSCCKDDQCGEVVDALHGTEIHSCSLHPQHISNASKVKATCSAVLICLVEQRHNSCQQLLGMKGLDEPSSDLTTKGPNSMLSSSLALKTSSASFCPTSTCTSAGTLIISLNILISPAEMSFLALKSASRLRDGGKGELDTAVRNTYKQSHILTRIAL